jgi:lipopolysaccharide export system permease protein
MKKILFRKLLSDYIKFFLISVICTSVVIWVFQAVNYLDIIIEDGRDYLVYIKFSLLNLPKIISKLYPFVLFFSLFYVTVRYELNNELIIFWNFGVNKIEIINFIFRISIVLFFFQIILTALIVPKSQDLARSFLKNSEVNFLDNFIKPQKFNDTIKGLTIYSDKKDLDGNLNNLYLKKELDNKDFQITYAKKGKFKLIGNTPVLVLSDGATITSKENEITNISFSKSDFSLANVETNTTTYKKTQELSSLQILNCIKSFYKLEISKFDIQNKHIENCSIQNIENILKEFYKRFIIPMYIPILCLVPFLLITLSKESSQYNKLRLTTFLIGLGLIIFSETTIKFISKMTMQNIILVLLPIIFSSVIYIYLLNKFKMKLNKII